MNSQEDKKAETMSCPLKNKIFNECPLKKAGKYLWNMKRRYKLLWIVVLLLCGGVYFITHSDWQSIVRNLVHKYGTQAVGTSVNVGKIDLSPLDGKGKVSEFTVANPKGYSADNLLYLGNISVDVDINSVTKQTVVINEIRIENPEITYEILDITHNNVKEILQNLNKNDSDKSKKTEKVAKKADSAEGKKVAIKRVIIKGGKVNVISNILGTQSLSIPLPQLQINNIGSSKKGVSITEGFSHIFKQILNSTTQVISKVDLSGALNTAEDAVAKTAEKTAETVGKVADSAGETAQNVAKGVGENVKGLADGVSNLWK